MVLRKAGFLDALTAKQPDGCLAVLYFAGASCRCVGTNARIHQNESERPSSDFRDAGALPSGGLR